MIVSFKGRTLLPGDRVQVYRNLHKGSFSIRSKATGLVLAHGDHFFLKDVVPIVNERIRQKVLSTQVRNVHAYLEGTYHLAGPHLVIDEIYYNPYKTKSFMLKDQVFREGIVYFNKNAAYLVEKKEG